jgi:DNA mismatch endonuclease (patch repair protein)
MQRQARSDTACERDVSAELARVGLRFAANCRAVASCRRRADFVFRAARVAVFVDGCFWHGCPRHFRLPASHTAWWEEKIARNRTRDGETSALLRAQGWRVVRVWEHEDPERAAARVGRAVARRVAAAHRLAGRARASARALRAHV